MNCKDTTTTSTGTVKVPVISGDLLTSDAQYLAHQCKCDTVVRYMDYICECATSVRCKCETPGHAAGVARSIFDKYPMANTYRFGRNLHILGRIDVMCKRIINMYVQYDDGPPSGFTPFDSEEFRLLNFVACLKKIALVPNIQSVSFPYRIGCGRAGGDWARYSKEIERFASENSHIKVSLYRLAAKETTQPQLDDPRV